MTAKHILVTGGARRLGRAMVEKLVAAGHRVSFTYRGAAEEAHALDDALGDSAHAYPIELDDLDALKALVSTVEALSGPLDGLINSASRFEWDDMTTVTAAGLNDHFTTNLYAPVLLTRALTEGRERKSPGIIINILDYKIRNLNGDHLSYTLTKLALAGFTEMAARSLAPNYRVCAVAPGYALPFPDQSEAEFKKMHDKIPLEKGPTPEDIADAVLYLVNADTVTGEILTVDGGAHMMGQGRDFMFW